MKALIAVIVAGTFAMPVLAQTSASPTSPSNTATLDRTGPTAAEVAKDKTSDAKDATKHGAHAAKKKAQKAGEKTGAAARNTGDRMNGNANTPATTR
jgi:hypothetical protein